MATGILRELHSDMVDAIDGDSKFDVTISAWISDMEKAIALLGEQR
jgi:hypothetical protein